MLVITQAYDFKTENKKDIIKYGLITTLILSWLKNLILKRELKENVKWIRIVGKKYFLNNYKNRQWLQFNCIFLIISVPLLM